MRTQGVGGVGGHSINGKSTPHATVEMLGFILFHVGVGSLWY